MSILEKFRGKGGRSREFVFRGEQFRFFSAGDGDLYFSALYPDQRDANQKCVHFAQVNGRSSPYPVTIFGDVLAIAGTIDTGGEPAPDYAVIFEVYDSEPELFGLMRGAALEVLGVDGSGSAAGFGAWQGVYSVGKQALRSKDPDKIREALAAIVRASVSALQEWRVDLSGIVEAEDGLAEVSDPAVESLRGN